MSVLSKLSEDEKQTIASYIEAYGDSDNCDNGDGVYEMNVSKPADIDFRLRFWDAAKSQYLENMFGDSLIKKIPVTYEKSVDDIDFSVLYNTQFYEKMSYFCWQKRSKSTYGSTTPDDDYIYEYDLSGHWLNPLEAEDEYWRRTHKCENIYTLLTNEYWLYDNSYQGRDFLVTYYGESVKITKGMKVSRALMKLSVLFDFPNEIFEEWRILHSQLINTKILTGNLCLSIHPMDYITMSDGAFTSCMNWGAGGGYRRGTVEMMNSEKVVVVYLESEGQKLEWYDYICRTNRSWNYKKWRTLIIVDPNLICSVKGYPYQHSELTTKAIEALVEMAKPVLGDFNGTISEFENDAYEIFELTPEEIVSGKNQHYITFNTDTMYNDFGTTRHYITFADSFDSSQSYDIFYSGESECMYCGLAGDSDDFPNEGAVYCYSCRSWYSDDDYCCCCNCGTRLWADDATWVDDDAYCDRCADLFVRTCNICERNAHIDTCVPLILTYKGIGVASKYDRRLMKMRGHLCVCESCLGDLDNYFFDDEDKRDPNSFGFAVGATYRNIIKERFEAQLESPMDALSIVRQTPQEYSWYNPSYISLDLAKVPKVYNRYYFSIFDIDNFDDFTDYMIEQERWAINSTVLPDNDIERELSILTIEKDDADNGEFNFLVSKPINN